MASAACIMRGHEVCVHFQTSALAHATGNTIMNCARNWAENIATSRSLIRYSGNGISFLPTSNLEQEVVTLALKVLLMRMIYFHRVTSASLNLICTRGTQGCFSVLQYFVFFVSLFLHLVAGSIFLGEKKGGTDNIVWSRKSAITMHQMHLHTREKRINDMLYFVFC